MTRKRAIDLTIRRAVFSGMTRPDIASGMRAVARHAHNPAARHWKAVRKAFTCLKGTKDLGVVLKLSLSLMRIMLTDATTDVRFQVL